jgi:hypothetical protein
MKAFISYSNRNRDLVETLAKDLTTALSTTSLSAQNEVWFDEQLVGGQDWWNTIVDHLLNCDIFVFALSPYSIKSDACQRELRYATDLNKRILPVWITGELSAMDLPELLQARQWINYSKQDKAAFQDMLTALRNLPAAQPPPDPLPTPPAMPLSPLTEISHQLMSDKIDRDRQNEMLSRLKEFLAQPDEAKDAYQLLLRLKQHPDLRRSVAEDIDDLLRDHPEYTKLASQRRGEVLPDIPVSPAASVPYNPQVSPSSSVSVSPPVSPSAKPGWRKWFGLNGRTIGLVIGVIGGAIGAQTSPTCSLDVYNNWVCNNDLNYVLFIIYILVWVGIGWGVDILWRRFVKKNNASTS